MEAPGYWDNVEKSQEGMKELNILKEEKQKYESLEQQYEDIETLLEMGYEENDESLIPEIQEELDQFTEAFEAMRIKTLLSGEYDSTDAIIKLNAGAGGTESCDWAGMLYRMYTRWAERKGFTVEVLDYQVSNRLPLRCTEKMLTDISNPKKVCTVWSVFLHSMHRENGRLPLSPVM